MLVSKKMRGIGRTINTPLRNMDLGILYGSTYTDTECGLQYSRVCLPTLKPETRHEIAHFQLVSLDPGSRRKSR